MRQLAVTACEVPASFVPKVTAPEDAHYDLLLEEPAIITEDGRPVAVFLDADDGHEELLAALRRIKYQGGYRTTGLKSYSRVFGFQPRLTIRRDFCAAASLARESPGEHAILCEWAKRASDHYRAVCPEKWEQQNALIKQKVLPEWTIPDSVFTSGIVNENNRLRYHYDTGNFPGQWNCMYAFTGDMGGGHLVVPKYRVAFSFQQRPRLAFFDAQATLHGVSPMRPHGLKAYRYSVVFYALRQMCHCLPCSDELLRIRRVKSERELKRSNP